MTTSGAALCRDHRLKSIVAVREGIGGAAHILALAFKSVLHGVRK